MGVEMMSDNNYYVYIMTNHSGTLYTGVTNNLIVRVYQHKEGMVEGFTKKYKINRLVYFEETPSKRSAIERERQIKRWRREKKVKLIESLNPEWKDLSEGWYDGGVYGCEK
jgi:putative endonuclease